MTILDTCTKARMTRARMTLAGVILAAMWCSASARAADYTTIVLKVGVNKPVDAVWRKVGGFCDISAWLKLSSVCTAGAGELGSMRRIADRADEVMVAETLTSYTYTQPASPVLYHGTLAAQADGADKTTLVYTLFYDQSALTTPDAKAADRARRTKTFTDGLQRMKDIAEGN